MANYNVDSQYADICVHMPAILGSRTNHSHGPAVMQMLGYTENIRLCPLRFTPAASCKLWPHASLLVVHFDNAPTQNRLKQLHVCCCKQTKKKKEERKKPPCCSVSCLTIIIFVITGVLVCLPGTIKCASIAPMHPLHAHHTCNPLHHPCTIQGISPPHKLRTTAAQPTVYL
jgi:hypothetical protein